MDRESNGKFAKKKDPKTGQYLYDSKVIKKKLEDYIFNICPKSKKMPLVADFLSMHNMAKSQFYGILAENEELKELMEILHSKQETVLVYGGLSGKLNTNMSMFILRQKQHGYINKDSEKESIPAININIPNKLTDNKND